MHITCFIFVALYFNCNWSASALRGINRLRFTDLYPFSNVAYSNEWFEQTLDHFQPTDTRTWQQRYYAFHDFYESGGPVFLFIGGEGSLNEMPGGAWFVYAKKYKALLFAVEHRYYGMSQPTSYVGVEDRKYLSSEQALADLAYFIVSMNNQHKLPPNTKWVAFGGSYAGSLAAWVRYKYPHLVHASVASSAPLLAKVDYSEFMDVVKASLAKYSPQCVEAIEAAIKEFNILIKTPAGQKTFEEEFKYHYQIDYNNPNNIAAAVDLITNVIPKAVQYDWPGFPLSIRALCINMVNESLGTPLIRLGKYGGLIRMTDKPESQTPYSHFNYSDLISVATDKTWNTKELDYYSWIYQTCTEFGFYQTSESKNALFGENLPLDFFIQECRKKFGESFTKELNYRAVDRTNTIYGGLDLKATRVVYVNGDIDPWHAVGITKTRIPQSPAIYIQGASHCADMYSSSPHRFITAEVKAAQKEISALIGKWLQEP